MRRLNAAQRKEFARLRAELNKAWDTLEEAVAAYNEAVEQKWSVVDDAHQKLAGVVSEANDFRAEVADQIQSYLEERSERWHKSDRADQIVMWSELWDTEFDGPALDQPEPLEVPERDFEFGEESYPPEPE